MRTIISLAAGLAALALSGCGGAKAGEACSVDGYRCDGASTVLECRDGIWLALPCSGPEGCASSINGIVCDITGNQVGDGCPSAMEGSGFCRGSPPALFACQDLQVVKLLDCSTCTMGATSITCRP